MSSLQILQNKAAKLILDSPLHSSASDALTTLEWVSLENRRYQSRCISYVYKCLNGLVDHNMDLLRHEDQHTYNTSNIIRTSLDSPVLKGNGVNKDNQLYNVAIFKHNILKY